MLTKRDKLEILKDTAEEVERIENIYETARFNSIDHIIRYLDKLYKEGETNILLERSNIRYMCEECDHETEHNEEGDNITPVDITFAIHNKYNQETIQLTMRRQYNIENMSKLIKIDNIINQLQKEGEEHILTIFQHRHEIIK